MKAAIWYGRRDVRIEDIPEPSAPPPGQVKIEVSWCGICGTDLHEYLGGPLKIPADAPHPMTGVQAPVVLGHELAGKIVEVGSGVDRLKIGDRVAPATLIGCLKCYWCKSGLMGLCPNLAFLGKSWHGGGFSRFVNVYDYMCYKLPPEVPDEIGAMVEPFAATVRAVRRVDVKPGETVAIVGAGPIGLMTLQVVRSAGAEQVVVIEPVVIRQELAIQCGATAAVDPVAQDPLDAIAELTGGDGVDVAIECAGVKATGIMAGRITRRQGRVLILGVFEQPAPLDYTDLVFGEKTVMGSMGGYGVFDEAIEMMAEGEFIGDPLITGRISLDDIVIGGFEELVEHKEAHIKILVSPVER
jgi:(R,R)-butanediol dehydrogenase/meso-butanediol dehydrogenase/diacetyl reductase